VGRAEPRVPQVAHAAARSPLQTLRRVPSPHLQSSIFNLQSEYLSTNHQIRLKIENRKLKMSIPWLGLRDPFPPVEQALDEPNGLLAAGGDPPPERLLDAYARGICPWLNDADPVPWWSPGSRTALIPR